MNEGRGSVPDGLQKKRERFLRLVLVSLNARERGQSRRKRQTKHASEKCDTKEGKCRGAEGNRTQKAAEGKTSHRLTWKLQMMDTIKMSYEKNVLDRQRSLMVLLFVEFIIGRARSGVTAALSCEHEVQAGALRCCLF